MAKWAEQAIEISQRFNALILPLYDKTKPGAKVNPTLPKHKDLPPNKLPSNDPDIIRGWESAGIPGYGVIPTDKFLVVDIDVKPGQHGKEALKFFKDHGLPLETFTVVTPSKGLHLYYAHPAHYEPAMSTDGTTKFEDPQVMQAWDAQRAVQGGTSGVDTRYGWSYVAGPGSVFEAGEYTRISNLDMAHIPSSLQIGAKKSIQAKEPQAKKNTTDLMDHKPGSIKDNRNDWARDWTFRLSTQRLPDSAALLMIKESISFYDNKDGEAPTYDEVLSMYERAREKIQSPVSDMLERYVYIVSGKRVLDIQTGIIDKMDEFLGKFTGKTIPRESANGVRMVNPVKVWEQDPDRKIVQDEVFDIGYPHGMIRKPSGTHMADYYNRFRPPTNITFDDAKLTPQGEQIGRACIEVIENIISSPYDRDWFRKWIGQMLFDPGTRPAWHWHIFSNARGIGKDTLASIISTLYGMDNIARFGTEAFEDKSNTEFFNCGLGIMSDFSPISGQGGRSKVLAQFKTLTGTNTGRMRAMYSDGQQRAVSLRFLMLSNSYNDFPVDTNDRRIFKCESKGKQLHRRTYALTHCFTDPDRVTQDMKDQWGIEFTDADRLWAHALILDYFRESGYDEMSTQFDCPQNTIKEENQATTEPKYYTDIRRAINHEVFVFASDMVTRDFISMFLDYKKVTTSVDTVIRDLIDSDVIRTVKIKSGGKTRNAQIRVGMMEYDPDLSEITMRGKPKDEKVYAVRNFHHWCDIDRQNKRLKAEVMKIVGYRGIMNGWDEKRAKMMSDNKVVPITDDDS